MFRKRNIPKSCGCLLYTSTTDGTSRMCHRLPTTPAARKEKLRTEGGMFRSNNQAGCPYSGIQMCIRDRFIEADFVTEALYVCPVPEIYFIICLLYTSGRFALICNFLAEDGRKSALFAFQKYKRCIRDSQGAAQCPSVGIQRKRGRLCLLHLSLIHIWTAACRRVS